MRGTGRLPETVLAFAPVFAAPGAFSCSASGSVPKGRAAPVRQDRSGGTDQSRDREA